MFTIKFMQAGIVTETKVETIDKLLPVMAHVQEQKLPYMVYENGVQLFKYNMQYAEYQQFAKESYTLKIKADSGEVLESKYDNVGELAIAVTQANKAGHPWYVVDNRTKAMLRKGNCDKLKSSKPVVETEYVSIPEIEDHVDFDLPDIGIEYLV